MTPRGSGPASCLLAVSLLLGGCDRGGQAGSSGAQAQPADRQSPVPVAVHVLDLGPAEASIRAWGTVKPWREARMLAEVSGRVTSVRVALGDGVERGQVLLEIDPALHAARLSEAESLLESARLTMDKAHKDHQRTRTLFERGTVSDSELEAAATRTAEAEAAHASARATLEQARKNLANARLRSPFAGKVASRPPDPGSTVNPGMALLTVVDIDRMRVETLISEQDLPRVLADGEASFTVAGAPGRSFTGRVAAIGPQADAGTRQFPVEIEVPNPEDHPLRGGMVAAVRIVYECYDSVPLIPVDALLDRNGDPACFVIEAGRARLRLLEPGPRQGQMLAVLGGAAPGDTVVVLGKDRLADGVPVRVEQVQ